MWLVVGLGNPGKKYERTRHNIGFLVADSLRSDVGLPDFRDKFSGRFTRGPAFGTELGLLEPQTFMNLSGDSVQPAAAFLKVGLPEILVIHDELDLPFGTIRVKKGGGHAGHNGLRSLIDRLGAPDFVRVRMGIGRPPPDFRGDVADYVLTGFAPPEQAELSAFVAAGVKAVQTVAEKGTDAAMNALNPKTPPRNAPKKA